MAEKKTKQDFSQKEAQRLGYDFAVVEFFIANDPDTLAFGAAPLLFISQF